MVFLIGETLRKEREKQRLTIQDIEEGTSIRASYIQAIESGEYDKMPGRVYAKGFVKNYANFLKLDGEEFVKKFLDEVSPAVEVVEKITEQVKEDPNDESKKPFSVNGMRLDVVEKISSNHLVVAIVILALLVGGFFYMQGPSTEVASVDTTTQPKQEVQQTTPKSTSSDSVIGTPVSAATPQVPQQVEGVNVNATFSDDCWMLVTIDGAVVYEGVITAGQVMDWKGNNNVNVRIGNAGAVDFVMNGQNLGKLGGDGDVVDKDFTR